MCGFAGITSRAGSQFDSGILSRVHSRLLHRGPDDAGLIAWGSAGIFLAQPGEPLPVSQVVLLHRRLSIIGLSRACRQPMQTEDGRFSIVFNGEIYNYVELRKELADSGVRCSTDSDTEVLLKAYATWGVDALPRLEGMFAFAILDTTSKRILLARDCFGIKPLYFARLPDGMTFASEIKALLEIPGVSRRVNPDALYRFLRFGVTEGFGHGLFAGISQIRPATYQFFTLDGREQGPAIHYWRSDNIPKRMISMDQASEELSYLFERSVRFHMRSDVPVGSALSGGIDSTAIVSVMRKVNPEAEIHTFSYIAEEESVGEEPWIDLAIKSTGAIPHKIRVSAQDLERDLDQLIVSQDEPFISTSIYAQHQVFKEAKAIGIKVVLDGQGADELFGGYNFHYPARLYSLLKQGRLPSVVKFWGNLCKQRLAIKTMLRVIDRLSPAAVRNVLRTIGGEGLLPNWLHRAWFVDRVSTFQHRDEVSWDWSLTGELHEALTTLGLPTLLRYEDRNSMANSVESRVPFLSKSIAEFALSLPEDLLISPSGETKVLLRRAMDRVVPEAIIRRGKVGFETPQGRWLLELRPWIERILSQGQSGVLSQVIDFETIRKMWSSITMRRYENGSVIWRCLNIIRWAELFRVEI